MSCGIKRPQSAPNPRLVSYKKGVPEGTPFESQPQSFYGVFNRKNCAGVPVLTGMALVNAPLPANTPVVLVIQFASGVDTLVAVSQE